MTDVADAVTELNVEPKKKPITKARVWNYVRGASQMPGWFAEAMDMAFPDWQKEKTTQQSGRQRSAGEMSYTESSARREAALIPSVGDPAMKDALQSLATQTWQGRTIQVPPFLDPRYPVQYVIDDSATPALNPGDAVQLRPNVGPLLNRLFAITERASGEGLYAVCRQTTQGTAWERIDGTTLPLDECLIDAAVIALLPQYTPGMEIATINGGGLDATFQIGWPKK